MSDRPVLRHSPAKRKHRAAQAYSRRRNVYGPAVTIVTPPRE